MSSRELPSVNRRHFLAGSAGAVRRRGGRGTRVGSPEAAPNQVRQRISLPSGVQTGDVTTGSGVLWARASSEGRLMARLRSGRTSRDRARSLGDARYRPDRPHRPRRARARPGVRRRAVVRVPGRHAPVSRATRGSRRRPLHPRRDLVRVDRGHRRAGLGDQPRPRRHDDVRHHARDPARLLHPRRRHGLLRRTSRRDGRRARRPGVAQRRHARRWPRSPRRSRSSAAGTATT